MIKTVHSSNGLNPIIFLSFFWGFCFFYLNNSPIYNDFDTAWHIAAGDLIRELGHLPKTDPWSFTAAGTTWYNISWLWDVLLSFAVQYLGLKALYFINVLLYSGIIAAVAYNLTARNHSLSVIAITVFIVTFVLWRYACLRPYSLGFLMLSLYQAYLYRYIVTKNLLYLLILPLLMLVWVNTHGGFFSGFILIGAYGLAAIAYKNWREMWQLMIVGILCLVCALVNPYGIDIYFAVTSTTGSEFTSRIDEWQRFSFANDATSALYLMIFLMIFNIRERSVYLADKFLALIWLFAGFLHLRNMPVFVICSTPLFAGNLSGAEIVRMLPNINTHKLRLLTGSIVACLVGILLLPPVSGLVINRDVVNAENRLPINATNYIKQHYPNVRFFNDYGLGTYIISATRGEVPVFVDGRAGTAYPENVLQDYLLLSSTLPSLNDAALARYNIGGVITFKTKPVAQIFATKPGWKQVFVDNSFSVFVRSDA